MEKEITDTLTKFYNLGIMKKYKLVLDTKSITKVLKKDLMNYLKYLDIRFPHLFKTQKENDEAFFTKISKKNKMDIVEVINYYVKNKNMKVTYKANVIGTSYPELVDVYIHKTVNKIVQ